jgi:hypothetical protein
MATSDTISKVFALVYFKDKSRRPTDKAQADAVMDIWTAIYSPVPDAALMEAATRFTAQTRNLYPGSDPFAMIFDMARPVLPETAGDCLELALEAIGKFGRYHEDKAMAWLKERSPLVAATVRRFGFVNLCDCENLEVARGQMRALFAEEKERAKTLGQVVETAKQLEGGQVQIEGPAKFEAIVSGLADRKALPGKAAA